MTASMVMRGPGSSPEKLIRAGAWAGRAAVVGASLAVVSALAAAPAAASAGGGNGSDIAAGETVSRAQANSFNISVGGQVAGSGGYLSVNDGALETVKGVKAPELPMIGDQQVALVGALGQDAATTSNGYAAACAGVVGANGVVKLGADQSCLVSGDGQIQVSLGTLDALGLTALLGGELPGLPALPSLPATGELTDGLTDGLLSGLGGNLASTGGLLPAVPSTGDLTGNLPQTSTLPLPGVPDVESPDLALPDLSLGELSSLGGLPALGSLPTGGLPDIQLMVVGKSITANCLSTPSDTFGKASPVEAQVVAVVAGQQIPVASVPPEGLDLNLTDVLSKVQSQLPVEVTGVLDQVLAAVPADQLDAVRLANLQVGEQTAKAGQISVTALGVETAYPGLVDLELGKVDCGSNVAAVSEPGVKAGAAAPQAGAGAQVEADGSGVRAGAEAGGVKGEGAVNADLAPASNKAPLATFGWGAVIALMLAGVGLAGFKLRRLIRH
ncbi:hypothetical protein ABN034_14195 [Actinopolymorpha sp. B11F2]|uniref:hypothetical protein n=1 Tax=Actinopolymorpha sp. B11F2 TaxID=3160862 RepID=UPI0032E3AE69